MKISTCNDTTRALTNINSLTNIPSAICSEAAAVSSPIGKKWDKCVNPPPPPTSPQYALELGIVLLHPLASLNTTSIRNPFRWNFKRQQLYFAGTSSFALFVLPCGDSLLSFAIAVGSPKTTRAVELFKLLRLITFEFEAPRIYGSHLLTCRTNSAFSEIPMSDKLPLKRTRLGAIRQNATPVDSELHERPPPPSATNTNKFPPRTHNESGGPSAPAACITRTQSYRDPPISDYRLPSRTDSVPAPPAPSTQTSYYRNIINQPFEQPASLTRGSYYRDVNQSSSGNANMSKRPRPEMAPQNDILGSSTMHAAAAAGQVSVYSMLNYKYPADCKNSDSDSYVKPHFHRLDHVDLEAWRTCL